jgi:hypothetical protein
VSEPKIDHRQLPGISPQQAHDARARMWAYVFECFNRRNGKEGGPPTARDDAKEIKNVRAEEKYTG